MKWTFCFMRPPSPELRASGRGAGCWKLTTASPEGEAASPGWAVLRRALLRSGARARAGRPVRTRSLFEARGSWSGGDQAGEPEVLQQRVDIAGGLFAVRVVLGEHGVDGLFLGAFAEQGVQHPGRGGVELPVLAGELVQQDGAEVGFGDGHVRPDAHGGLLPVTGCPSGRSSGPVSSGVVG